MTDTLKTKKLQSTGYTALNGDTLEYEDIKNLTIRFGVEKFNLTITQASESIEFLSRLFLLNRGKNEVLIKKDYCVTSLDKFRPKEKAYPELSYRINCSFLFEHDYEGVIENAQCSISLRNPFERDKDKESKERYSVYLTTNSSNYSSDVSGHLLVFSNPKVYRLFENVRPLLEFDIYSGANKIGWGYFQSGLTKIVSGIKL